MSKSEDDLRARVTELENKLNPPPRKPTGAPYDHTQGMSMPRSAVAAMVEAIPESVMNGLRADAAKANPITVGTSQAQSQSQPQAKRTSGWIDERPLETPPGVAIRDGMMDAEAAKDKAELAMKIMHVGLLKPERKV
jgi:hypothetical protein